MIQKTVDLIRILRNPLQNKTAMAARQLISIQKMVNHAYQNVPYYHSLLDRAGIHPKDIRSFEDFQKIPITTKASLKQAGDSMLSTAIPRDSLIRETTSGSTGKPLELFKTRESLNLAKASKLRTYLFNGYRLNEKIAEINFDPTIPKWFHRLGIHRTYEVPFNATLQEQVDLLKRIRPAVISSYPSRLYELMLYLRKKNITEIRPRIIFTQAEALLLERRQALRDWFGVDPTEIYSTQEFQYVAWECPDHQGLHINSDLFLVELIKMDGSDKPVEPGELGYVVITDFTNTGMPFIRYNIEDLAENSLQSCTCRVKFPLLKNISGRKIGLMKLPDGNLVPGDGVVSTVLAERQEVEHFCCRQKKDGSLYVEIVTKDLKPANEEEMLKAFQLYCGPIQVTFSYVSEIQKTAGGKHLPFVSEIL